MKTYKMMNGLIFVAIVLGLTQAHADESETVTNPDASASITDPTKSAQPAPPSTYDKISKHVGLSYYNVFRGAPLSDVTNRYQPAPDGSLDTTNTQNLESTITAGWKFSKDWLFGTYTHFYFSPMGNPTSENNANMQWLDPALLISKANMVETGGLKIKGQLSATLPVSQYDTLKKNGLITGITPMANILYEIPKTKLTIGLYTYFTAYIPGSNAIEDHRTMKLIMAPNANYQINKSLAATLWIDAVQVKRYKHSGFFSGMNNPDMDIEPGINWDINQYLSFNPFLNIYPSKPTLSATSFQAALAGKIF